jgi:hypothetical protein
VTKDLSAGRSTADARFGEVPPDRPRLGALEHPNLDRPGAQQHPSLAVARKASSAARPARASERRLA